MLTDAASIVEALTRGLIVAIPTDTVYGVAASAASPDAVARLFALKDRPVTTPLPVLVADLDDLRGMDVTLDARALAVVGAFWPGPLTVVIPAPAPLARLVGAPTPAVGFRQPDDGDVRRLLRMTGPLCVTSANTHGAPPCLDADEVELAFFGRDDLDLIVDGGRRDGPVSTVLDLCSPQWRVVREGAVPLSRLARVLGDA